MRKMLYTVVSLVAMAAGTGAAHAVTVTVSPLMPANDGQFSGYVTNCFNCDVAPASALGTWIPDQAGIFDHAILNYSAEPPNGGAYYSVYNGLTLQLNAATAKNDDGVSFVWGSPSYDNVFAAGNFVINGQQILDLLPAGDIYGALVTITGLPAFHEMTFNQRYLNPVTGQPGPQYAFEFDNVSVLHSSAPVPEASTWAMMLAGFAGLGYAAMRKGRAAREAV